MLRTLLKSKIHRARVTDANLNYEGSLTIDSALMKKANIIPYEKIDVVNINNGARFSTYAIEGKENSGEICLNGAAARKAQIGDKVIIVSYGTIDFDEAKSFKPRIIFPDDQNKLN